MKRAALLLAAIACGAEPAPPAPPSLAPAAATPPTDAPPVAPPWPGVMVAAEAVDVAPAFDGVVANLAVRAGDVVAEGAIIATLDVRRLRDDAVAADHAARAAAAVARRTAIEVERAKHQLVVAEAGLAAGTEAQVTVDDARLTVRTSAAAADEARAAGAEARALAEQAGRRVDDATVRAPFAGTIALRYVDPGASVGPRQPIARLVSDGPARLRFGVSLADAARVPAGALVRATLDDGTTWSARVVALAPEVDQASQRVYVDAVPVDAPPHVGPGVPVTVHCGSSGCATMTATPMPVQR